MRYLKSFLILTTITFIFLEAAAIVYFKFISNDKKNLETYINKRIATDQYQYYESVGLVLPKPNLKIYHNTSEFTDIFETRDILNRGMGFFDDGIDNKKIRAVAIGDSFTRGVGSIDNLKNGWVELVEKNRGDIDIVNLGNLGGGINDQKYGYDKIKNLIDHELVIYNFYSGADYIDNLNDKSVSYYIMKKSKTLSYSQIQEMIKDLNKRHGYKHHLEYLKDNNFKSYAFYLILKVVDYLNIKKIINTWEYSFKYDLPDDDARLNVVEDELYQYHSNKPKKIRCIGEKYCVKENIIFQNEDVAKKIILNTANKINQFFYETIEKNKDFILIIHPSSRYFYPEKTNINYSILDVEMINQLDNRIKVIDLKKDLIKFDKKNPEKKIFYKYDAHYTIEGYKIVSEIILKNFKKILR